MTAPSIIDTTGRPAIELSGVRAASQGSGSGAAGAPHLVALAVPGEPMLITAIPTDATEWRVGQRAYLDLTAWTDAAAVVAAVDPAGAAGVRVRIEWSPVTELHWQPLGGDVDAEVELPAAEGVAVGESVTLSRDTMQPCLVRWVTVGGSGAESAEIGNVYLYLRAGAVSRVSPGSCNSEIAAVIRAGGAFYGDDFCWATTTPEFRAGIVIDHRYQAPANYTIRGGTGSKIVDTTWNGGHRGLTATGAYPDSWLEDDLATAFARSSGITQRLRFIMGAGWSAGVGGAFDLVRVDASPDRGDFRWAAGIADVGGAQRLVLRYQAANGALSWTVVDLGAASIVATGAAAEVLLLVECIDAPSAGHQHVMVQAGPALGPLTTYYDEVQTHAQSVTTSLPAMAVARWSDGADMAAGMTTNPEFTVLEWEAVRPCDAQLSGLAINGDLAQDLCGLASASDLAEQLASGETYEAGHPYRSADTRAFRLNVTPDAWNGKQSLVATGNASPKNALSLLVPISSPDIWVRAIIRNIRGGIVVAHANVDGKWVLGSLSSTAAPGAPRVLSQTPGADGCTQVVGASPLVPAGVEGADEQWEYAIHAVLDVDAGSTTFTFKARMADRSGSTYTSTTTVSHVADADLARDWRVVFFPSSILGEEIGAWEVVDGAAHPNPFGF